MNRLTKLEDICQKIGIFTYKKINGESRLVFGPYGHMLLNQIKNEWIRTNTVKYTNNYLIKWINLSSESDNNTDFDVDHYCQSLKDQFNLRRLPFGAVNVYESGLNQNEASKFTLFKNVHRVTNLNYFYLNDLLEIDCLTYWQNERRRWWIRHMQNPQNVSIDSLLNKENTPKTDTQVSYNLTNFRDVQELIQNQIIKPHVSLETITYFNDVYESQNKKIIDFYERFSADLNEKKKKKDFLMTQTSCESILENILIDSLNIPDQKSIDGMKKFGLDKSEKAVFELDFRLAPYKACILFESDYTDQESTKDAEKKSKLITLATDLKKLCYLNNVNVFMMSINDEKDLNNVQTNLDLMGVPFSIYLPSTIVKDGICHVRNRDTSLSEHAHYSNIAKNFKSYTDSLNF
jgi:glycyl-tRNA synthetase (class II)